MRLQFKSGKQQASHKTLFSKELKSIRYPNDIIVLQTYKM